MQSGKLWLKSKDKNRDKDQRCLLNKQDVLNKFNSTWSGGQRSYYDPK